MRLLPLLLLSASLVLAGCAKEDDPAGDGGDTTTTTTTPPTGNTTTTTAPTSPTGDDNNTTTTGPTPMELCAKTKDFAPPNNPPSADHPSGFSTEVCGTPAAEYTKITMNVTWAPSTAVPATNPVGPPVVKLVDSAGADAGSCTGPTGQTVTGQCVIEATIVPGEYTLAYESSGNLKATIQVMVS